MLLLEFDGLFRSSPGEEPNGSGILCYGWRIMEDDTRVLAQGYGSFLRGRNANANVAEYIALLEGLEALLDMGAQEKTALVRGDAKSVILQLQGIAGVSSPSIQKFYRRAQKLVGRFRALTLEWKPRRYNRAADALSRYALRRLRHNHLLYEKTLFSLRFPPPNDRLVDVDGLRIYQPCASTFAV